MRASRKRVATSSSPARGRRGSGGNATHARAHAHAHAHTAPHRERRACCSGKRVLLCTLIAVCAGLLCGWLQSQLSPTSTSPTMNDTAALRHALTHAQQQQQLHAAAPPPPHMHDVDDHHRGRRDDMAAWRALEQLATVVVRVTSTLDVYLQQLANQVARDGVTYDDTGAAQLHAATVVTAELLHEAAEMCYDAVWRTHADDDDDNNNGNNSHSNNNNSSNSRVSLARQRVWAAAAFAYGTALPEYHLLRDESDEHVRALVRLVNVLLLSSCSKHRDDHHDYDKNDNNAHARHGASRVRRWRRWWRLLLQRLLRQRRRRDSDDDDDDATLAPEHVRARCHLLAYSSSSSDETSATAAHAHTHHHSGGGGSATWRRFCQSSLHNCTTLDTRVAAALEELIALQPRNVAFRAHYAAHYVVRHARALLRSRDEGAYDTPARRQAAMTALRLLRSDRARLRNATPTTITTTTTTTTTTVDGDGETSVPRALYDLLEAYVLVSVADAASVRVLHDRTAHARQWRQRVVALVDAAARALGSCTRLTQPPTPTYLRHDSDMYSNSSNNSNNTDVTTIYWPSASSSSLADASSRRWRAERQPPLLSSRDDTRRLVRTLSRFVAAHARSMAHDDNDTATTAAMAAAHNATLAFLHSCID